MQTQKILTQQLQEALGIKTDQDYQEAIQGRTTQKANSSQTKASKKQRKKQKEANKRQKKKILKIMEKKAKAQKRAEIIQELENQAKLSDTLGQHLISAKDIGKRAQKKKEKRRQLKQSTNEVEDQRNEREEENSVEEENAGMEQDDERERVELQKIPDSSIVLEESKEQGIRITKRKEKEKIRLNTYSDDEMLNSLPNEDLAKINASIGKQKVRSIKRKIQIQKKREELPIMGHQHQILELITNNLVCIICGETGSGKSTQIPQFLYETSFGGSKKEENSMGMIGITQPRRVAAVSLAHRLSQELNCSVGKEVGYQIRYDSSHVNERETAIKFMTDGILLKELESDFLLLKYSVILIDEAHERSINTDTLISLLSRIIKIRAKLALKDCEKKKRIYYPLRLVIMSATLRVTDFTENAKLFPLAPPVLNIPARQFEVSVHFNKVTKSDYLEEAFLKTCKIHRKLPPGGVLVFVTGKSEVLQLCRRLRLTLNRARQYKRKKEAKIEKMIPTEGLKEIEDQGESQEDCLSAEEAEKKNQANQAPEAESQRYQIEVMPLYSMLPKEQQMKVFNPVADNRRLVVVSTNIAETSLTIPGIKYVVDCGREKNKEFDPRIGLQQFKIDWISKASADQRAGRAGRVAPGHCYRLYSSAVFDSLPDFSEPQIRRQPIDQTILSLKSMGVSNLTKFPFVTPPSSLALLKALQHLWTLGALTLEKKESRQIFDFFKQQREIILNLGESHAKLYDDTTELTTLGKLMSCLPLAPQYSKLLVLSKGLKISPYIILLVAGLTVDEVFSQSVSSQLSGTDELARINRDITKVEQELVEAMDQEDVDKIEVETLRERMKQLQQNKKEIEEGLKKKRNHEFRERLEKNQSDYSDAITLVNVLIEFFRLKESHKISSFGAQFSLNLKSLMEIKSLVHQLISIYVAKIPNSNETIPQLKLLTSGEIEKPTQAQEISICKIITAALCDKVARRKISQIDQDKKKSRAQYQIQESTQVFYIHPSSGLYRSQPQYLVYTEVYTSANGKSYLKNVTQTSTAWLCSYGKALIFTPPIGQKVLPKQILQRKPAYNEKKD